MIKKLFLTLLLATSLGGYAQVTIGSHQKPETFSALQLDETADVKGLRLPQVNPIGGSFMYNLDASDAGLMLYSVRGYGSYWDGTQWVIAQVPQMNVENGLNLSGTNLGEVKLGGSLTENTEIGLSGKALSFDTGTSHIDFGGYLKIEPKRLTGTAQNITFGKDSELQVSGYVADITNPNTVKMDGALTVYAPSSVLDISKTRVAYDSDITLNTSTIDVITDEALTTLNIEKQDFVFSKDNTGEVFWAALRSDTQTKVGKYVTTTQTLQYGNATLTEPLELERGTWLIYARLPIKTNTSSTTKMHVWYTVFSGSTIIVGTGANVDAAGMSIAEIISFYEVTAASETIVVKANSSTPGFTYPDATLWDRYGQPEFFAILLDKPVI